MKYPFSMFRINITTRCNFSCKYCGVLPGGKNLDYDEAPPEKWMDAVARQTGKYAIVISGGEPALYGGKDGLGKVVDSFSDIPTKIYTNASKPEPILAITNRKNLGLYISYHYKKIHIDKFKENVLKFKKAGLRMSNIHCPTVRIDPEKSQIEADLLYLRKAGLSVALDHPYLGWKEQTTTGRLNDKPVSEMMYYDNKNNDRTFAERKFRKRVRCFFKNTAGNSCMYFAAAPDGSVFYCYRGFIEKETSKYLGNFFDSDFVFDPKASIECNDFGWCNLCDGFGRHRRML